MSKEYLSKQTVGLSIHGVWSVPRLGLMDNFQSVYQTLPRVGIPLSRGCGAFWGQALERTIDRILEKGEPEAILTMDYDTVFSYDDLIRLIELFKAKPEAAAIAPFQWSRTADKPLWTTNQGGSDSFKKIPKERLQKNDLVQMETLHFGLTLIRTSVFKSLPRPRFMALPNDKGMWENGKIDDDIHFWKLLQQEKHPVYLAPKINVGHIETCVTWPGKDMTGHRQRTYDYFESGKPYEQILESGKG